MTEAPFTISLHDSLDKAGAVVNELLFNCVLCFFSRKIHISICTHSSALKQRLQKNRTGYKEMGEEENVRYFQRHPERMLSLLLW